MSVIWSSRESRLMSACSMSSHGIRGVRAGSLTLAQSLPEAPEDSIHLAVVDPGVGHDRRAVAIACGNGSYLVGPDNGLFFPVADARWCRSPPSSSPSRGS